MNEKEKGGEKETINCKVVLIGRSTVGKTSIISRYTTNIFKESLMTTPGANFITKKVDFPEENETIKFEIWDTAGQERYRALAKVFYKNASACILVYDITNRASFDDIKTYWIPELKENSQPNISKYILKLFLYINIYFLVLVLAGNKSDNYMNEQVTDNEGKALAKEINAIYKRTSAKLNTSIDEMFNDIGKKFLNPNSEITSNLTKEEMIQKSEKLRRDQIKNSNKNKNCC
jgi:small GTP-binding protein